MYVEKHIDTFYICMYISYIYIYAHRYAHIEKVCECSEVMSLPIMKYFNDEGEGSMFGMPNDTKLLHVTIGLLETKNYGGGQFCQKRMYKRMCVYMQFYTHT